MAYFKHESASAELKYFYDGVGYFRLVNLYSEKTGQGHATELMKKICSYADERGIDILLRANPFGHTEGMLEKDRLIEFYKKFGFEVGDVRKDIMYRKSQTLQPL